MEIRTAEEYIVSELLEAKENIAKLTVDLTYEKDSYDRILSKYNALRALICRRIRPSKRSDGQRFISFDEYVWERYDKEEFDEWVSFFPDMFVEPEEVSEDE